MHTGEISISIQNFIMYENITWRNIASVSEIRVNVYLGPLMAIAPFICPCVSEWLSETHFASMFIIVAVSSVRYAIRTKLQV